MSQLNPAPDNTADKEPVSPPASRNSQQDILIVGGGLAGLCCARQLHAHGIPFTLLEGSDRLGGRIKTDVVDGFLLDRGFQVLLTAYPEAQSTLSYLQLELQHFLPGALVRAEGSFYDMRDPWREITKNPLNVLKTAFAPIGTFQDKLRLAALRKLAMSADVFGQDAFTPAAFSSENHPLAENVALTTAGTETTHTFLKEFGFSDEMIEKFLGPFFRGIFLEPDLQTTAKKLLFVFQMFSTGTASLPANGMGEIPRQLMRGLPKDKIRLNAHVQSVSKTTVKLMDGETLQGRAVVIACDRPSASQFVLGMHVGRSHGTLCLYFDAPEAPIQEPILILNGSAKRHPVPEFTQQKNGYPGASLINNMCFPSQVAASYAPKGKTLVSVSIVGNTSYDDARLEKLVREELSGWFGEKTIQRWRHLKTYRIHHALPAQPPENGKMPFDEQGRTKSGLYVCGDYMDYASIQGAMLSGRKLGETLVQDFSSR